MILVLVAVLMLIPGLARAQTVNHSFQLKWTNNAANAEGSLIYRDGAKVGQVGKDVAVYTDTVSGTPAQQFCYEVSAFKHEFDDGTGKIQESSKSTPACNKIPQAIVVGPPNAPSGLSTSAVSISVIRLSWAINSDNETGFQAERRGFQPPSVTILNMP